MNKFRTLNANEIECRIAQIHKDGKGLVLLLYKDARVDQNVLDETVGPLNWQRSHQLIGDRLYCTISIWDDEKKQWISKQDVGTESYTEKEKGQASDSFKRAAFNFGIGRELYTAPFIWINSEDCNIKDGKCYDTFEVTKIGYNENREINMLEIINLKKKNQVVFSMGIKQNKPKAEAPVGKDIEKEPIDKAKVATINKELKERGITSDFICNLYKVKTISGLNNGQFMHIINNWDELKKRFEQV